MNSILKLGLNLFVICAVAAGLLAGTNQITAPLIEKRNEQANNEARQTVLSDAKEFKLLNPSKYKAASDVEVVEVYEGVNGSDVSGYTIKVLPKGYGGEIELMVGIKKDGNNAIISGVNTSLKAIFLFLSSASKIFLPFSIYSSLSCLLKNALILFFA